MHTTQPGLRAHQATLARAIACSGTALHSGAEITLTLKPAPADHGIVLRRTDLGTRASRDIPARYDHVVDTRLCTVLANPEGARVATVEHVLAALAGAGIDNALVEVNGPEMPIMDGSSEPFTFLLGCAGVVIQPATRRYVRIERPIRVSEGDSAVELSPGTGRAIEVEIDFTSGAIGRQLAALDLACEDFSAVAPARTFGFAHEVEAMRQAGLARGGSLANAIVVEGDRVLNPEGLRSHDEFARHKLLDAVGDLALAGAPILGLYRGVRPGHRINNLALRGLFADPEAWSFVEGPDLEASPAPADQPESITAMEGPRPLRRIA